MPVQIHCCRLSGRPLCIQTLAKSRVTGTLPGSETAGDPNGPIAPSAATAAWIAGFD